MSEPQVFCECILPASFTLLHLPGHFPSCSAAICSLIPLHHLLVFTHPRGLLIATAASKAIACVLL